MEEGIPRRGLFYQKAKGRLKPSPQYYRTDDFWKNGPRDKGIYKTVQELQTVLSDVHTVEDAIRAYDRFFADNGYLERAGKRNPLPGNEKGQDNP